MSSPLRPVADGLVGLRTGIVNVYLAGPPGAGDGGWVLIDAALPGFAGRIRHAAADRFGAGARPAAVVLTHGHQDHVGALASLLKSWGDVPVYAHPLELPYLTGRSAYPPPDPTVGGGALSATSFLFSRGPFNFGDSVRPLPADGTVPGMPGWTWMPTPGHTPGHVSFWRESDRTLVAGDAFVTQKQESLVGALTERTEVHGPPMYYTPDWDRARASVEALAALEPEVAATGHGVPLRGYALRDALHYLADNFEREAVPAHGRYVPVPALADEDGVYSIPPPTTRQRVALGVGVGVLASAALAFALRARRD